MQVGGRKVVRLGDKDVEWDDSFRLYLITHLPNPAYGPEVASKTMLINYSVTEQVRPCTRMPMQVKPVYAAQQSQLLPRTGNAGLEPCM